jgi:hypothetical protein
MLVPPGNLQQKNHLLKLHRLQNRVLRTIGSSVFSSRIAVYPIKVGIWNTDLSQGFRCVSDNTATSMCKSSVVYRAYSTASKCNSHSEGL